MIKGYVSIVLHSHMPFVRHPEAEDALEERWLFEAMCECYLPLIDVYDNLIKDGVKFKLTMSITPPLMEMLEDDYLNKRFSKYMGGLIELSEKEIKRTKDNKQLNIDAEFYHERFTKLFNIYKNYNYNIMNAFRKFDKVGCLEIITCSATHALLPLLMINPEAVKAQLAIGVESYIKHMGHAPKGIWLPECAYTYNLDYYLKQLGIRYFICESVGVLDASPRPKYGTYTPIATPSGVCAFGRDMESSYQVWSNFMGYPGDFDYREFYRDIGYEAPMEYIAPYINQNGIRIDTGIKYYRITGKTENKDYYHRDWAMNKVKMHAGHFSSSRDKQIEYASSHMDAQPMIVCPYDAELFGHWWFEGPDFINEFIRKSAEKNHVYKLISPSDYLDKNPVVQCSSPSPSTWGENSDFSVWLNPSNQWIYKDLHRREKMMIDIAKKYKKPGRLKKEALNQLARELVLAESSDWPFIIKNNTTVDYAVRRIKSHIGRFDKLYDEIINNNIDRKFLEDIRSMDNIFKHMDYRVYTKEFFSENK